VRGEAGGVDLGGVGRLEKAQERLGEPRAPGSRGGVGEVRLGHPEERLAAPGDEVAEAAALDERHARPHPGETALGGGDGGRALGAEHVRQVARGDALTVEGRAVAARPRHDRGPGQGSLAGAAGAAAAPYVEARAGHPAQLSANVRSVSR
jgi:hypothetical protein